MKPQDLSGDFLTEATGTRETSDQFYKQEITQKTIPKVGKVNLKQPPEINNGEDDWSELSLIKTFQ